MTQRIIGVHIGLALLLAALVGTAWHGRRSTPPIRIGALHSLTGTMSASETPLVDVLKLGVAEINERGGLLGRPLELVVADGRSDWDFCASEAERLIGREKVSVLFACWTSACRKAVKPVVERLNHLMLYPVQYEGLESSKSILYAGSAPNQQIVPGVRWALDHFGSRIYLVGSDYIFPRTANRILRDIILASGGQVLGEQYIPLGSTEIWTVVQDIQRLKPQVVLNTLNGDTNAHLFKALLSAGLESTPLISFSVSEQEMISFGGATLPAHYAIWNYFQSLPNEENRRFVSAFKARYGQEAVLGDPVEATYSGLQLWAQAVLEAGSADPRHVDVTLLRQSFRGPSGIVSVNPETRHLWKSVRIGKVNPDGQFEVVDSFPALIRPAPYPAYRTRAEWERIAADLNRRSP